MTSPASVATLVEQLRDGSVEHRMSLREQAADTIEQLERERERMREAIEHAEHVFRCYAELHDRKGTNEGREKARRNMEHAERMSDALTSEKGNG